MADRVPVAATVVPVAAVVFPALQVVAVPVGVLVRRVGPLQFLKHGYPLFQALHTPLQSEQVELVQLAVLAARQVYQVEPIQSAVQVDRLPSGVWQNLD
jgi:hypothetical protein